MTARRVRRRARWGAGALALTLLAGPGCSYAMGHGNGGIPVLEEASAPVAAVSRGAKYAGWLLGAPLALGLAPLAFLAAATPWVDLPTAMDVITAPALGLGYTTQALVGFPTYGALSWRDDSPRPARVGEGAGDWSPERSGLPYGLVLEHRPAAAGPRPAAPLPAPTRDYYAPDPALVRELEAALASSWEEGCGSIQVPLGGDLPATLEVFPAEGPGPHPLVLLTPPNRVTGAAHWLASWFAERGLHGAVLVPDEVFLTPGLPPAELERKLRAAVTHARAALAALAGRPEVDPAGLHYMGISAGGVFGAALVAVEPALRRAVLWLPGGDLPRIVATSEDRQVTDYRESWEEAGLAPADLQEDLAQHLRTDPLLLAPHVDPARVLMFLGAQDTRVPTATGLALHEALGEPEVFLLAGRHASAVVCFGYLLRETEAFLLDGYQAP